MSIAQIILRELAGQLAEAAEGTSIAHDKWLKAESKHTRDAWANYLIASAYYEASLQAYQTAKRIIDNGQL